MSPEKGVLSGKEMAGMAVATQGPGQKTPPPKPPFPAGCFLTSSYQLSGALHRDFVQADVLDHGPDNHEATGLGCEHVDLIGALPQEAPQTLNGIGRLNVPMHAGRELVKRQALLFFLSQTSHGLGIAWYAFSYRTQA
jgi:hypothetical protein